jgi:hypothetical protein
MNLDVDYLIDFFKKYTDKAKGEIGEQDAPAAAPASSTAPSTGGSGKAPPKWADSYPLKRGKSNPLMKSGEKWETGLTRGAANQIW